MAGGARAGGGRAETTLKQTLAAGLTGLLLLAAIGPARADEGLTTRAGVVPMVDNGHLVGCQAPFEVVRADPEYSGGRRVRVEGRMSVIAPTSQSVEVMLQMSVHAADEAAGAEGVLPASLMLRDGTSDSRAERFAPPGERGDPDLYLYNLGPVTRAALTGAADDGRFTLAYALKADGPMAPLTVDLTVKRRAFGGGGESDPAAPRAFADCLRRLRLGELTH